MARARGSSRKKNESSGGICAEKTGEGKVSCPTSSSAGVNHAASPLSKVLPNGGQGGAPGYDAAVGCDVDCARGDEVETAVVSAAMSVEVSAGVGAGDIDDDSSDGGAAHEEISAWLHSTEDWWIS